MNTFSSIFFKMRTRHVNGFYGAVIQRDCDSTGSDDWLIKLTDLVAFGEVWIKIVFPIKHRLFADLGIDRETEFHCHFKGSSVRHWKNSWHS